MKRKIYDVFCFIVLFWIDKINMNIWLYCFYNEYYKYRYEKFDNIKRKYYIVCFFIFVNFWWLVIYVVVYIGS